MERIECSETLKTRLRAKLDKYKILNRPLVKPCAGQVAALEYETDSEDSDDSLVYKDSEGNPVPYVILANFTVPWRYR